MSQKSEFLKEREEQNETVMKYAGQTVKRYYSLDSQAYRDGALSAKQKELLGLVASLVLRDPDDKRRRRRRRRD